MHVSIESCKIEPDGTREWRKLGNTTTPMKKKKKKEKREKRKTRYLNAIKMLIYLFKSKFKKLRALWKASDPSLKGTAPWTCGISL